MGDGDSHEVPSFTGRVWLAAAAQLPEVRISAKPMLPACLLHCACGQFACLP